jgi:nucleoid-associated protein YgaU
MVDCPCGFGKNIREDQTNCPICGADVTPLHRLKALPRSLYEEGLDLLEKGDSLDGANRLAAAVALDADNAPGHLALGRMYLRKKLYPEAKAHLEKSLDLAPDNEEARKALQDVNDALGKPASSKAGSRLLILALPALAFVAGLAGFFLGRNLILKKEPRPDLSAVLAAVQERITAETCFSGLNVEVTSTESGLRISGQVPSLLHKAFLAEMARHTAGSLPLDLENLSVIPPPVQAGEPPPCFFYEVQPGENLRTIAIKFYGRADHWSGIYEANREQIRSPHRLSVGQVLKIPVRSGADAGRERAK